MVDYQLVSPCCKVRNHFGSCLDPVSHTTWGILFCALETIFKHRLHHRFHLRFHRLEADAQPKPTTAWQQSHSIQLPLTNSQGNKQPKQQPTIAESQPKKDHITSGAGNNFSAGDTSYSTGKGGAGPMTAGPSFSETLVGTCCFISSGRASRMYLATSSVQATGLLPQKNQTATKQCGSAQKSKQKNISSSFQHCCLLSQEKTERMASKCGDPPISRIRCPPRSRFTASTWARATSRTSTTVLQAFSISWKITRCCRSNPPVQSTPVKCMCFFSCFEFFLYGYQMVSVYFRSLKVCYISVLNFFRFKSHFKKLFLLDTSIHVAH